MHSHLSNAKDDITEPHHMHCIRWENSLKTLHRQCIHDSPLYVTRSRRNLGRPVEASVECINMPSSRTKILFERSVISIQEFTHIDRLTLKGLLEQPSPNPCFVIGDRSKPTNTSQSTSGSDSESDAELRLIESQVLLVTCCRKPMLGKRLDQSKLVTERRFNGVLITKGQNA